MVMPQRRAGGQALLLVLMVLLLVMLGGALVDEALAGRQRATLDEARRVELDALADGAMAEALAELSRDGGFAGAPEHPLGRGRIASRVTSISGTRYEVVAWATLGSTRRTLVADVDRPLGRPIVLGWRAFRR